jgi:hypothetical protein
MPTSALADFSVFWIQPRAAPGRQNSQEMAMRIKMDTSMIRFMITKPAVAKMDRETARQKVDKTTGALLWQVQLMALDDTGGEILTVTVDAEPKLNVGQADRSGVAFRAGALVAADKHQAAVA